MAAIDVSTTYLPLTTTFSAPTECFSDGPWILLSYSTTWWKVGDGESSCWPSAFPFSDRGRRLIYSPGVCPSSWSSACERAIATSGSTQRMIWCCPASFECASTDSVKHRWEDRYGCASSYSVDTVLWGLSPEDIFVSSMYQQHVMIVEATPTQSSSTFTASSVSSRIHISSVSTSTPTDASPTPGFEEANRTGLSVGEIAGVVIGSLAALAFLAAMAYMLWSHRKKKKTGSGGGPHMLSNQNYDTVVEADGTDYHIREPVEMAERQSKLYELHAS